MHVAHSLCEALSEHRSHFSLAAEVRTSCSVWRFGAKRAVVVFFEECFKKCLRKTEQTRKEAGNIAGCSTSKISQILVRKGCWLSQACAAAEWSSSHHQRARAWRVVFFFCFFSPCSAISHSRGFEHPNIKSKQNRDFLSALAFSLLWCDGREILLKHSAE